MKRPNLWGIGLDMVVIATEAEEGEGGSCLPVVYYRSETPSKRRVETFVVPRAAVPTQGSLEVLALLF